MQTSAPGEPRATTEIMALDATVKRGGLILVSIIYRFVFFVSRFIKNDIVHHSSSAQRRSSRVTFQRETHVDGWRHLSVCKLV